MSGQRTPGFKNGWGGGWLRGLLRTGKAREPRDPTPGRIEHSNADAAPQVEISPEDPLMEYFLSTPEVTEVDRLDLDSPALTKMKKNGAKLAVPLVSQGELVGLLCLGPRLSEQEYSPEDRRLLKDLASQTAPAVRVAQLVRQQQLEAKEIERIEQELRVARIIQQTLLPRELPALPGYEIAAHYRPAREVGGDFYDFLELEDGRLGILIGDVTDKGVPAALVMATTRSVLRSAALRLFPPGEALRRVNELMVADIPPNMFITCLYAILDPRTGALTYANAGHDLPYLRHADGAAELRARGMPLGLMPGMEYEEKNSTLEPGDTLLLYSDGLVEAHAPDNAMFGFPRLQRFMSAHPGGTSLVTSLLAELQSFTGPDWEQEDDITLVTLQRTEQA